MSNWAFKLKVLRYLIADAVNNWRTEIWPRDPDETYCCDGRECACGGVSVREMWTGICDD